MVQQYHQKVRTKIVDSNEHTEIRTRLEESTINL